MHKRAARGHDEPGLVIPLIFRRRGCGIHRDHTPCFSYKCWPPFCQFHLTRKASSWYTIQSLSLQGRPLSGITQPLLKRCFNGAIHIRIDHQSFSAVNGADARLRAVLRRDVRLAQSKSAPWLGEPTNQGASTATATEHAVLGDAWRVGHTIPGTTILAAADVARTT